VTITFPSISAIHSYLHAHERISWLHLVSIELVIVWMVA
jgi:hypothetical protein